MCKTKEEFLNKIQESLISEKKLAYILPASEISKKEEKEEGYTEAELVRLSIKSMNSIKTVYDFIKSAADNNDTEVIISFDDKALFDPSYKDEFYMEMGIVVKYFKNKGYQITLKKSEDKAVIDMNISWRGAI